MSVRCIVLLSYHQVLYYYRTTILSFEREERVRVYGTALLSLSLSCWVNDNGNSVI